MKKTSTLNSKLMKYASAAGAVLTASAAADAQVNYTNVDPDFTHSGGNTTVGLDVDNDGNFDYVIASIDTTVTSGNTIKTTIAAPYGTAGNEIAGSMPGNYNYALALDNGTLVDASLNWIQASNTMAYNVDGNNPYSENWNGVTNKFIGLRFSTNGMQYYGWARMDVDAAGDVWTLKDYAYEATAGTGITTDMAMGLSGNDLVADQVVTFASNKVLYVNVNGDLNNGKVMVTNLSGQVVAEENLLTNRNMINLSEVSTGIYLVTSTFAEGIVTQRVFVK